MATKQDLPIIPFASRSTWEEWLAKHHATSDGLWLKFAKKGSGIETVSFAEALDTALCYGWIDSQRDRFDKDYFLHRFTPRKSRSKWSKINRDKVTKFIQEGEMKPAGLQEVEKAKADGRWDAAYASQSAITVPEDLQQELDMNPEAAAFFETLNSANRYAILYRIGEAKKPETRARRIEKYVMMLSKHEKPYP